MFRESIARLATVERFDRIINSKDIKIGAVEVAGRDKLAIQVSGDTLTLEDHGQRQLLGQWGIPADHFARLPKEIQAAELQHFSQVQPKELTLRAVKEPMREYPAARAFLSGRYSPFDNADVLNIASDQLAGFELNRPEIGRDEMSLMVTRPELHDVSVRKVGDIVKTGLRIGNSEIGTMAASVEFCLFRLVCTNGMVNAQAEVTVRQRHIFIDRRAFAVQIRNAISNASEMGRLMIDQLRNAHALLLPSLDPEDGKLQREVAATLRKAGLWTVKFQEAAREAISTREEASLFGLVQYLTDWRQNKDLSIPEKVLRERTAGQLMQLAA